MSSDTSKGHWVQADARQILPQLHAESVDLIITDPPYASLDKHRARGTTTRLQRGWFNTIPNDEFGEIFAQLHRVLKKNAHLYVFCDDETRRVFVPLAEAAGFTYWKSLVWDKARIGMGYHYRAQHEYVLFFEKGKRPLNDLGVPDVLRVAGARGGDLYPTQKPVDLLTILLRQSSAPGEIVLDPFAGSGATGIAAQLTGRMFVGIDTEEAARAHWERWSAAPETWPALRDIKEILKLDATPALIVVEEEASGAPLSTESSGDREMTFLPWSIVPRTYREWKTQLADSTSMEIRVNSGRLYLCEDEVAPLWCTGVALNRPWAQALSELAAAISAKYGFVSASYIRALRRLPDPR